jgi:hemoglobin-like flavoprotein
MPSGSVESFRASLGRCLATPGFLHYFYDRFMESSEEVREKFKQTEFARQTRILTDSLYIMAVAAESQGDSVAWQEMDRLAARHSRTELDVRPQLYETWLECLLMAVKQFDPEFTPDVATAWREVLAPGIARLRSRY